jgi:hypothetical protein
LTNLAQQLADLQARGFAKPTAQVVVLVRESAILLFKAFPDCFLLYRGANLRNLFRRLTKRSNARISRTSGIALEKLYKAWL